MKHKKLPLFFSYLFFFVAFSTYCSLAQNSPVFELKDSDRVVFLGNSLFENEGQYGYLELALTTRWPGSGATFRNLGWTGDNVWGEARSTFTNPPTPYQHLIQQLTKAQPTIVFVAYGGVEAREGEAGIPRFKEGLNKLLDKMDSLGAKTILLSPIPVMYDDTSAHVTQRNANLALYASVIAQIASERNKAYMDIYKPIQELSQKVRILENGVHLNETGYYYLAAELEKGLGLNPKPQPLTVTLTKESAEASVPAKILAYDKEKAVLTFSLRENFLPLPLPQHSQSLTDNVQLIKIAGLKKGFYTLRIDDLEVVTASAKTWAEGVSVVQGPNFNQANQIREMILKKNEQFFFQYRPLNRTYILGFRSYEQGRHAKGLEDQSLIIKWLEGQIALRSMPKTRVYQLTPVK
ncbi:MAG: GDSL-type esterase/lipase family protein [Spirosomataceae bacterium]